jgi:hypothetical protein
MAEGKENIGREVVFENMNEFHSFISERSLHLLSEGVRQFYDSFESINVGCGCRKKRRVEQVTSLYLAIPGSLDEHRKYLLHRVLSDGEELAVKKIIFKHDGEQFGEIEFEVY